MALEDALRELLPGYEVEVRERPYPAGPEEPQNMAVVVAHYNGRGLHLPIRQDATNDAAADIAARIRASLT